MATTDSPVPAHEEVLGQQAHVGQLIERRDALRRNLRELLADDIAALYNECQHLEHLIGEAVARKKEREAGQDMPADPLTHDAGGRNLRDYYGKLAAHGNPRYA